MNRQTAILLIIGAVAALIMPWLVSTYMQHLLIMALIYALLASGLNLVIGYVGELSLGHAAFFGIGAYAAGLIFLKSGLPLVPALIGATAAGALAGWIVGFLCLRVRGPYFVIVTLGIPSMLHLVAKNWVEVTNGPMGLTNLRPGVIQVGDLTLKMTNKIVFYYFALIIAVLAIYLLYRLVNSHVGRAWVALRENEELARSVGVDRYRFGLAAVILGGALAGLGGGIYGFYISLVSPDVFAFDFMLIWLIMVITGGKGTVMGPLLGAVLFTIIPELLRAVETYRLVIFGALLMLVTLFLPRGLWPMLVSWFDRERTPTDASPEAEPAQSHTVKG